MAAPTNYVLTVYKTEAAAITGDTSTAFAVDADGKINTAGQGAGYGFWTHEKYWYRIEANEPVTEFYIDWDDGDDNNPSGKANYTTIKFDTPTFVGITSHIYTGNSGTGGGYFPKIRCKSIEGYWSKFYQNRAGAFTHTGIDVLTGETSLTAGRNNTYRIESDASTEERIPALYPEIKPPVAILKSDKKRVYAGINNRWLFGTDGDADGVTCSLEEGYSKGSTIIRSNVRVKVTYIQTGLTDNGDAGRGDIISTIMTVDDTISYVSRVLKMELLDLLEDTTPWNGSNPANNKLYPGEKLYLTAGTPSTTTEQTIGEVSLGNPIIELDDPRYTVTYDLTESFARTPEQTINNYYIDDGARKLGFGFASNEKFQRTVGDTATTAHSDTFLDPHSVFDTTSGIMRSSYSFETYHHVVDEDFRWLPRQLLARGQITATNPLGSTAERNMTFSYLEHWINEGHAQNYSDTREDIAAYNWTSDMSSSAVLAGKFINDPDRWYDLEATNRMAGGTNTYLIHSNNINADGTDDKRMCDDSTTSLADADNITMILCARDSKWTKQFWTQLFNANADGTVDGGYEHRRGPADYVIPGSDLLGYEPESTRSSGVGTSGIGHMQVRVEAFYTAYEHNASEFLAWKPLKYLNKTKHPDYDDSTWYTDGVFEWEEPDDWASCDPADIKSVYWRGADYYSGGDHTSFAFSSHNQAGSVGEVDYFENSDIWDSVNKKYAILFKIKTDGGASDKAG